MGWGSSQQRRLRHHAAAVGAARATAEPRAAPRWRAAPGAEAEVRVAAVQISGYDKGELPRPGYDPVGPLPDPDVRGRRDGLTPEVATWVQLTVAQARVQAARELERWLGAARALAQMNPKLSPVKQVIMWVRAAHLGLSRGRSGQG